MPITLTDDELAALGSYLVSVDTTLETMDAVIVAELADQHDADLESLKAIILQLRLQTANFSGRLRLPITRAQS